MDRKSILILSIIALIVVFVFVVLVSAIQHKPANKTAAQAVNPITTQTTIAVQDVVNAPLAFDGLTIEIEGTITRWINKKTFYVSSEGGVFDSGSRLLIISTTDFPLPKDAADKQVGLGEKVKVHVAGKARIVDREILGELTTIDLKSGKKEIIDTGLTTWRSGIVLVVDKVEKL